MSRRLWGKTVSTVEAVWLARKCIILPRSESEQAPVGSSIKANGQKNELTRKDGGLRLMDKCSLCFHFPKHHPENLHHRKGMAGSTWEQNRTNAPCSAYGRFLMLILHVGGDRWMFGIMVINASAPRRARTHTHGRVCLSSSDGAQSVLRQTLPIQFPVGFHFITKSWTAVFTDTPSAVWAE